MIQFPEELIQSESQENRISHNGHRRWMAMQTIADLDLQSSKGFGM